MKSKLLQLIDNTVSDFIDLINKRYNIKVESDWDDFQSVHFFIYKIISNTRK